MPSGKPIARLLLGWLLMLTGVGLMLESGMPVSRTASDTWAAVQALTGLVFTFAGSYIRRGVFRPSPAPRSVWPGK